MEVFLDMLVVEIRSADTASQRSWHSLLESCDDE